MKLRYDAATLIQRAVRIRQKNKREKREIEKERQMNASATHIQKLFRGKLERSKFHNLKAEKWVKEKKLANLLQEKGKRIQFKLFSHWSKYTRNVKKSKDFIQLRMGRKERACFTYWKRYVKVKLMHKDNIIRRVQIGWRDRKKERRRKLREKQERGAIDIQRVYRGYLERKRVGGIKRERDAAVLIQKVFRGHMVRRKFYLIKSKKIMSKVYEKNYDAVKAFCASGKLCTVHVHTIYIIIYYMSVCIYIYIYAYYYILI